jgi:hypothetical protein
MTDETPAAIFRARFDELLTRIAVGANPIFDELVMAGSTNNESVKREAARQAKRKWAKLTRGATEEVQCLIPRPAEAEPGPWRAPRFLLMFPAGPEPYDADRAWERLDAASTERVLSSFADEYERRLNKHIERRADEMRRRAKL